MIVGACGFGSTGSSVICDYLLEFDDVEVLDKIEFDIASGTDGLADLEFHLMHPHNRTSDSIYAIKRFRKFIKDKTKYYENKGGIRQGYLESRTNEFLDSIVQLKWNWVDNRTESKFKKNFGIDILMNKMVPRIERKLGHEINVWPMSQVEFSAMPSDFYKIALDYVDDLLVSMGSQKRKITILDQPFAGNNPQASFPFYKDPYAIVVDRDPRDNYVFAKTKLLGRNHFMAVQSVEAFCRYYRLLRDNQPYREENERILVLKFEDLVYEYEKTTQTVRNFLKLDKNLRPKTIFDPSLSIANTQVYKRFPKYSDDIKYIEDNLTEYLYPFEKFGDIKIEGKMFSGKSPLHSK